MLIFPMEYRGDEHTRTFLDRAASVDGPEREALAETHGQVSLDRAPHRALRDHYLPELP